MSATTELPTVCCRSISEGRRPLAPCGGRLALSGVFCAGLAGVRWVSKLVGVSAQVTGCGKGDGDLFKVGIAARKGRG